MKKIKEIVHARRGIAGVYLRPADAGNSKLLLELFGGDPAEMEKPIQATLEDVLKEVREVAASSGITMSVCGNRKHNPTIHLWGFDCDPREPMLAVFENLRGDAAHCGIADFYPEHAALLRAAILSGGPFSTGWFCVKKEIESGQVTRSTRNGPIEVEVRVEMDDPLDLADTAFWTAAGGNAAGDSGRDVLRKLGLSDARRAKLISEVARYVAGATTSAASATLHRRSGFGKVCSQLEALASSCDQELKSIFQGAVEFCSELLDEAKTG